MRLSALPASLASITPHVYDSGVMRALAISREARSPVSVPDTSMDTTPAL